MNENSARLRRHARMNAGHLFGFFILVYLVSLVLRGDQLVRGIAWLALWQILTPTREWFIDLPLLIIAFATVEIMFNRMAIK